MVQGLIREGFVLLSMHSQDLDAGSGMVEVTAEVQRYGRDDVALEAIVSRISREPSVSSVSWSIPELSALPATEE